MNTTLKTRLVEWTDSDWAAYFLGISIGMMPDEPVFGATKHILWTDNPVGNMLYTILDLLVEQAVLEKREEPDVQYRWNHLLHG